MPGAIASSSSFNELVDDIGDEITDSLHAGGDRAWSGSQNANGHQITNLAAPTIPANAATKAYVDALGGLSAKLAAIDALTWEADRLIWITGAATCGLIEISDFARTIIAGDDAAEAQAALGLGTIATQNKINDDDWLGTDLAVANGGTGASDADTARTNLGLNPYTGSAADNISFPVGSYLMANPGGATPSRNSTVSITLHANGEQYELSGGGTTVTGTWHCRGHAGGSLLVQRIA